MTEIAEIAGLRTRAPDEVRVRRLGMLVAIGLLVRVAVSYCAVGTNDALTWLHFGQLIGEHGLMQAYQLDGYLNHPPLMCWYARGVWAISKSEYRFVFLFRFLPILADVLTCWLLVLVGKSRDRPVWGWALAAAFAWNPIAILVSGYHTNTDSLYVTCSLAAAYLVATRRPFYAGLALGAALNVKLIPLVLVPPLLAATGSWRAAAKMLGGLALMFLPFVPLVVTIWPTIKKNMLDYNSNLDRWGFVFFLYEAVRLENVDRYAKPIQDFYRVVGRYLVLGGGAAIGIAAIARPNRWSPYALAALAFCSFLIFTPGFGVQYLVCVTPFLLIVDWRRGWTYAALGGAFVFLQYWAILDDRWPLLSYTVDPPLRLPGVLFGLLAWVTLIAFSKKVLLCGESDPTGSSPDRTLSFVTAERLAVRLPDLPEGIDSRA